jgi:hypothetical protein
MPIDSDIANADSHLFVEFYEFADEPYKGVPFVRIMSPGDKTNVIETFARDHHKERFHRQCLHFEQKSNGSAVIGTPLLEWHKAAPEDFSQYQMAELEILKFQTVEQIATATDSQLQRVGMGAVGLRERARDFLKNKNQVATSSDLDETKRELEDLRAQVVALTAQKRGPGRPKTEA